MEADEIRIASVSDELLEKLDVDLSSYFDIVGESDSQVRDQNSKVLSICSTIELFSPSPQLLDSKLRHFIEILLYEFSTESFQNSPNRVRTSGLSTVLYTFTKVRGYKAVSLCLDSDIYQVERVITLIESSLDDLDGGSWKERYFLLLWLSILILSPFPLESISTSQDIAPRVWKICRHFLGASGKEADVAPLLTARMISRVDCSVYLSEFYEELERLADKMLASEQVGYLSTLNSLLKIARTDQIREYTDLHLRSVISLSKRKDLLTTTLKLCIKNLGKLGKLFALLEEMEQVEDALDTLLQHVGHKQTIIRSCVSRQIAKISIYLPLEFKTEVFSMLVSELEIPQENIEMESIALDLPVDQELLNVETYHGILLTIAEFARFQILQSEWLPFTASLLHKTLFVEQHQLSHTTGSSVRDSSCFIAWSISKKSHIIPTAASVQMFKDLVLTACYDQDLMIRRAAAAALQELVGRHGDEILSNLLPKSKHNEFKVKLIEMLDFTALGLVSRSFAISVSIVKTLDGLMLHDFWDFLSLKGIYANEHEFRRLSAATLPLLATTSDEDLCQNLLTSLVARVRSNPERGQYYTIAELSSSAQLAERDVQILFDVLITETFDFHKDPFYKGEEILYLLSVLMRARSCDLDARLYDLIFEIIRLPHEAIVEKFLMLASTLSSIPKRYQEKWIYYIRHNNVPAARAIGSSPVIAQRFDDILDMISDETLDTTMRANLLKSVSCFLKNDNVVKDDQLCRLTESLDDYTTTKQGDVGHVIRLTMLQVISDNLPLFKNNDSLCRIVELKTLRLACEVIDKVKYNALSVLLRLKSWDVKYASFDSSPIDSAFVDNEKYFMFLFGVFHQEYLHNDEESIMKFMQGYSFSAGAMHASDLTVNTSFRPFLHYMEKVFSDEERKLVLDCLLKILKPESKKEKFGRYAKLQTSCLQLWVRILDFNVSIPIEFNLRGLFIRSYNLHIKTSQFQRISIAIEIFAHLYLIDKEAFADCQKRLVWISGNHPLTKARLSAQKALLEIENS
ncbi:unnamed protein product [Kuraishia capsulata CBS 1993]|uniref:Tubulin-folding cofactor D ARM repeats domain-containing protein n=1 Tax=Kuraishia capsulata CBS 1993 TaxID=1382522 RepID=W6MPK8_9ASCO|nr:uncharacterized protein KUCA_T00004544001 [Kuraishia capsulata CBS 1993]CDK28561.1 unnamed protein product [Kuraishia capsulata CBS 1993]